MPGKRIVFCTFGTLGDLHPFIALARELKRRGHSPVVATTATYRARVEAAGVAFHPVRPDLDLTDPAMLRRAVNRWDGARYIACELIFPYLRETYEDTAAAAHDADLLVTHARTLRLPVCEESGPALGIGRSGACRPVFGPRPMRVRRLPFL